MLLITTNSDLNFAVYCKKNEIKKAKKIGKELAAKYNKLEQKSINITFQNLQIMEQHLLVLNSEL